MRRPLYYYTHIPRPFAEIADCFGGDPGAWLPEPATTLEDGRFEVRLLAEDLIPEASVLAAVSVGSPAGGAGDGLVVRSLSWEATRIGSAFPVLRGDLQLEELTPERTQVTLAASYKPPLSVVGAAADRLAGRHVAEAVVRRFVLDLATELERTPTLAV